MMRLISLAVVALATVPSILASPIGERSVNTTPIGNPDGHWQCTPPPNTVNHHELEHPNDFAARSRYDDCRVNAQVVGEWKSHGLKRYEVQYSDTRWDWDDVTRYQNYCDLWSEAKGKCGAQAVDLECQRDPGRLGWYLRESEVMGQGGVAIIHCMVSAWVKKAEYCSPCTSG